MLIVLGSLTASLLVLEFITLIMPNASYVEIYLNDQLGLMDSAYRTFRGQIPSIDFKSLYGAAIYYPAALGFYLDLNAGAVLGFGHFVTAVPLLIMASLACYRRFPILHSVILLLFLFLLIVVPMRLGGIRTDLRDLLHTTRMGGIGDRLIVLPGAAKPTPQRLVSRFHRPISVAHLSLLQQDHVRGGGIGLCDHQ